MSTFNEKKTFSPAEEIFDREKQPVIRTVEAQADQGKLAAGLLVALVDGKVVPYKKDYSEVIAAGDGAAAVFSGVLTVHPVQPASLSITDGAQTVTSLANGQLVGDGSGWIDWESGRYQVTFDAAPADGADVTASHANKLYGVMTHDCFTSDGETSARVLRAGAPIKDRLLVGGDPAGNDDIKALEAIDLWPK